MIKGVILDLDGTLIDSMGMWYDIDRKFLAENGVNKLPDGISWKIKQMTIETAAQYMISEFSLNLTPDQVIKRIEDMVREEYELYLPLKRGATNLLDFLDRKHVSYGVATATYKGLAVSALKRCGILDRMAFLLTDQEYPNGKGFPDIFLGAANRLGITPPETLVVEDSLHSIETATNAGFITAAVYEETSSSEWDEIKSVASYSFLEINDVCSLFEGKEYE